MTSKGAECRTEYFVWQTSLAVEKKATQYSAVVKEEAFAHFVLEEKI